MKKYLASFAVVSMAGEAAILLDNAEAAPLQTNESYVVTADVLRVRAQSNTPSSIIGQVYEGQVLQVIAKENGWLKINHKGRTGYVSGEFVKGEQGGNSSESVGDYYVNASALNVRSGASMSYGVIGSLSKGTKVTVLSEQNGWSKINYKGKTGYISSQYLSKVSGSEGEEESVGDYYVNASALNVRSGAGMSYGVIGSLSKGTKVTVLSEQNGWSKINYKGKTGYISSQYLSKVSGSEGEEESVGDYYVNASALNVRSGAGTSYGVIGSLSKGTKVTVLSEQNGWSKINYKGKTGYISGQYLSKTSDLGESNTGNHESGFIKPTSGIYTSEFGVRNGQMHHGLDIAASGTVSVVAAADGKVTRSYYSASYGNVVFVSHNISGEIYTTLYAHLKERSVSVGQSVKQGQQVGFMGQTGQATGQHLHFEIHKGEWNAQKSNAVDPKLYIN